MESQVSNNAIIREMDADELLKHAQFLYDRSNWCGLTLEERNDLERCKRNYKNITGDTMPLVDRNHL